MKNKQGLTIAALIIAIVGLSIGFAAFSNTLNISSSASVNPDDSAMNVVWSSSSSSASTQAIVPTLQPTNVTNFTATNATITGEDFRTLSNVSAAFTAPGQSVTYNLHVFNAGQYTAYLTNLAMGNKTCDAIEQQNSSDNATGSLVQAACNGISISVTIGTETLTSSGSLNNQVLAPNTSVPAQVVITYASGSSFVDGPMSVTFDNITFNASTVVGQQSVNPNPEEQELVIPDYVVTPQGEITAYYGSATEISIPSSLPLYTQSNIETLVVPMCVDMAVKYASYTPEDALTTCEDIKTQVESGDTSSPFYSGLKEGGAIVYGYYATGNNVTVTSIGEEAFDGKNLTSVTIPNTVETIGDYAFKRNEIETLNLSNATSLTSIGSDAFYKNRLTSVTIPDSVTTIGALAFDSNRLITVTIGSGITSIGKEAFYNGEEVQGYGPNAVTKVTINAHEQDVYVDESAFGGFNGTICWLQDDSTCVE